MQKKTQFKFQKQAPLACWKCGGQMKVLEKANRFSYVCEKCKTDTDEMFSEQEARHAAETVIEYYKALNPTKGK